MRWTVLEIREVRTCLCSCHVKKPIMYLNIVLNLLLVYIQANVIALTLTEIFSVKIKTIETYHALELSPKFLKSI